MWKITVFKFQLYLDIVIVIHFHFGEKMENKEKGAKA